MLGYSEDDGYRALLCLKRQCALMPKDFIKNSNTV